MSKHRPLSFAVFDEFGRGADDRVQDHVAAEVARAVAAERERCAKLSIRIGNKKDSECPSACNGFWPDQVGFAIATAIRSTPQRLQATGE